MGHADVSGLYKKNQILTASPKKLIELLYSGAIKAIRLAEMGADKQEFAQVNQQMIKAQEILLELMSSLNMEIEGELAKNLNDLYFYMHSKLIQANVEKNVAEMIQVRRMLQELLDTWKEI